MKICKRCKCEKPFTEFRVDERYKDGFGSWCAPCHRERNSEWAKENRERLTAKSGAWRASNIESARDANRRFKRGNKEKLSAIHAEWVQKNKDKRRATHAKRKAAKLRAMPVWADADQIKAVYQEAVRLQTATDQRMHVDHIVPLQHDLVCGLHTPANLQVLPGRENEAKKNYWWPDMFITKPEPPKQEALEI